MKSAIQVFDDWSLNGKDEGMEKVHSSSVEEMLTFISNKIKHPFSFIDAGCGNGWTIRRVLSNPLCKSATGIDGATGMIDKAKTLDSEGNYICADLIDWIPEYPVDVVLSMEVFYYVSDPKILIQHVLDNWLKPTGYLIVGVDFYKENEPSLSWQKDCGISTMTLFSEKEWLSAFEISGFKNVKSWHHGAKDNWSGTLILSGEK